MGDRAGLFWPGAAPVVAALCPVDRPVLLRIPTWFTHVPPKAKVGSSRARALLALPSNVLPWR
jgi:hypothetical protein